MPDQPPSSAKDSSEENNSVGAPDESPEGEEDLPKICPNCMTPNSEHADQCSKCFTPLSAHATIDPIMSIAARGDTFYKASNKPQKPIVFIGIWLLFGTLGLFMWLGMLASFQDFAKDGCLTLPIFAVFFFIAAGILYKTTTNYFKQPKPEEVEKDEDDAESYAGVETSEEGEAQEKPGEESRGV